ncbi:MAG: creatininase family protein [Rhodobacteraceae bacterium]|nr:creatininase family protein [Paracoccaceae bacterium]
MPRRFWAEFRASEFKSIDAERTIAILPTAAVEQHGPHLPLGTDSMIAEGMLKEMLSHLPAPMDIRILPVQSVGKSNEHLWAVGTLTLSAATALQAWTEIGTSVARAGVRKIVVVNSHGGNLDLVSILCRELRVKAGMFAVKCQWGSFGHPPGMYSERERAIGIHGGDVETSLMLHFRPKLVDMALAQDFPSTAESDAIPPTGGISYGWIARDLGASGVAGNASAATAAKGKATARHQALGFIDLLRQVEATSLSRFAKADKPD